MRHYQRIRRDHSICGADRGNADALTGTITAEQKNVDIRSETVYNNSVIEKRRHICTGSDVYILAITKMQQHMQTYT